MQKLYVQAIDEKTGKKYQKPVEIIKAWIDSKGKAVYRHRTGEFAAKDGTPFKSLDDFEILKGCEVVGKLPNGEPKTRLVDNVDYEMAKRWWETIGKRESELFYAKQRDKEIQRYNQGIPVDTNASELDMAMYTKQPVDKKGRTDVSAPMDYHTWFGGSRPDWWGQADMIVLNGYRYRRHNPVTAEEGNA